MQWRLAEDLVASDDNSASEGYNAALTYAAPPGGGGTYYIEVGASVLTTDPTSGEYVLTMDVTAATGQGGITLTATGYKVKGVHHANLEWSGATLVDIWRSDSMIAGPFSGTSYTDNIGNKGRGVTYTYQVCETGTSTCSNVATGTF